MRMSPVVVAVVFAVVVGVAASIWGKALKPHAPPTIVLVLPGGLQCLVTSLGGAPPRPVRCARLIDVLREELHVQPDSDVFFSRSNTNDSPAVQALMASATQAGYHVADTSDGPVRGTSGNIVSIGVVSEPDRNR